MPDFVQTKNSENKIKDVGNIENCVLRLLTSREQKQHSLLYHVLYAVVVSLLGYIVMDGVSWGLSSVLCLVSMFVFPALFAYTLLFSPGYLKAVCTFSPFILYCFRSTFLPMTGEGPLSFAATTAGFIMCLAIGGIMSFTAIKKKTKLWCLVAVTICTAICLAAMVLFAVTYAFGSFDISNMISGLNDGIDSMGTQFRSLLIKELNNPDTFKMYTSAFPEFSDKSISEIALYMSDILVDSVKLLKNMLPAIFILVCMFYSFIFVGIFSVVARIHHIPLYICIVDNRWCYRVPASCITFFDIVLLFAIIDSFIALPYNISLAVVNLLIILVPIVTIATFKALHFFLYGKTSSKVAAYVLCTVIAVISLIFLGLWGYLLLCSIGVSFVAQRYRIESELAKAKILSDIDLLLVLCGCKEPVSQQNTSFNKNVTAQNDVSDNNTDTDADDTSFTSNTENSDNNKQ